MATKRKARKFKTAEFGSVSHGTMRPEDLIPTFADTLRDLGGKIGDLKYHRLNNIDRLTDSYWASNDAQWDLETLFERLESHSPPFGYFGSNEGDGADYGFWFSRDSFGEACWAGEVLKIPSGDEWPSPLPDGTEYVAEVTDHGNVTLWAPDESTAKGWAIVWELV